MRSRTIAQRCPRWKRATRVVYMPGRDLSLLAEEWLAEGLPASLPCAVVSRAAQPEQQVVHTTLGALGEVEPAAAPSLLIAGWAVRELRAGERPVDRIAELNQDHQSPNSEFPTLSSTTLVGAVCSEWPSERHKLFKIKNKSAIVTLQWHVETTAGSADRRISFATAGGSDRLGGRWGGPSWFTSRSGFPP